MPELTPNYKYYCEIFENTPKPFAFTDLDLLNENIQQILKRTGSQKKIRVASKSVRCRAILERVFAASPQFQGIMSFHPQEAVWLSQQGFDDILMGYPVWHETDIRAVAQEVKKGKMLILMIDSPAHVQRINAIGQALQVALPVCIDVDMSSKFPGIHFGVFRSSVHNAAEALEVYEAIEAAEFVTLDGIMGYEAQIAGLGDKIPRQAAKNAVIKLLKKRSIKEIARRRASVVQALEAKGAKLRVVNGGGTGSLESTIQEAAVTEVTVGSGFYTPGLFDNYSQFSHLPAAAYAIEVVRQPLPHMYTCLGGGYVASGAIAKDKQPVPYLPQGFRLTDNEGTGEVQTPITYQGVETLTYGSPVFLRHSKAGELCERFNEMYLVSEGKIVGQEKTFRGEGKCFL
jgi:D-serine deaminase-like pyridoxal phosphate-dependent protein